MTVNVWNSFSPRSIAFDGDEPVPLELLLLDDDANETLPFCPLTVMVYPDSSNGNDEDEDEDGDVVEVAVEAAEFSPLLSRLPQRLVPPPRFSPGGDSEPCRAPKSTLLPTAMTLFCDCVDDVDNDDVC